MPKRVAILQSSYIPWKGYFDIIHDVDEFIFLDHVQYSKNGWRNRNRIKSPTGSSWLTIPVGSSNRRRICDVELPPTPWAKQHWERLEASYRDAPYFDIYRDRLRELYLDASWRYLSDLNQQLVRTIACELLQLPTRFRDSRELEPQGRKQELVLEILERVNADVYISGPSAKAYLDSSRFAERGIELVWKEYVGYPEYRQLHPPFTHEVTILDLLFHVGAEAPQYIWGWRAEEG